MASASASATLATAFPGQGIDIARVATLSFADHVHTVAARGKRAYALVEQDTNLNKNSLKVARSDDGGVTWGMPAELPAAVYSASIAIDAGDDDTFYVTTKSEDAGQGSALTLVVSKDGGKSFTSHVLFIGGFGETDHADVASPSPDHVVVTAPATYINATTGEQGMILLSWQDAKKGDALASIAPLDNGYNAHWSPGFSQFLGNGRLVETGTTRGGPTFATNGKGALCMVTNDYDINGTGESHYVMCSSDQGTSWDKSVTIAMGLPDELHRSRIAMSKDGKTVVVAWNAFTDAVDVIGSTHYAVSTDGGASFDIQNGLGPVSTSDGMALGVTDVEVMIDDEDVIWFARPVNDLSPYVQIDKSCDKGKTLSGAFQLTVKGEHVHPFLFHSDAGIFAGAIRVGATDVGPTAVKLLDVL
jgi:hypothetical protein